MRASRPPQGRQAGLRKTLKDWEELTLRHVWNARKMRMQHYYPEYKTPKKVAPKMFEVMNNN